MNGIILFVSMCVGFCSYWLFQLHRKKYASKIAEITQYKAKIFAKQNLQTIEQRFTQEFDYLKNFAAHALEKNKQKLEKMRAKLERRETKLLSREEKLNSIQQSLIENQTILCSFEQELTKKHHTLKKTVDEINEILLSKCEINPRNINNRILQNLSLSLDKDRQSFLIKQSEYLKSHAKNIAHYILSVVISRCKVCHWADNVTNTVVVDDRTYAQKILSNAKFQELFLEQLKVELILEQDQIIINDSDGYGREICRRTLEEILEKKWDTVEQIAEVLKKFQEQMEQEIMQSCEDVCQQLNIKIHDAELTKLVGRLKYRTSFGQNVLWHSQEVAILAYLLAGEMGFQQSLACKAGLLHDIGKAIDHETEGGHVEIGEKILMQSGEPDEVIEGVVKHHDDVSIDIPYASLVNISDAISAARSGARRETLEKYIKKLETLESIVSSVPGVINAYAISAGREVRAHVDPEKIPETAMNALILEIAKAIEQHFNYIGMVKITLIRELEFVAYAKN